MGSQGGYHGYPMGRIPKPPGPHGTLGPHRTLGPHGTPGPHGPWALGHGGHRYPGGSSLSGGPRIIEGMRVEKDFGGDSKIT